MISVRLWPQVPNAHVFDDFGGKAMGNWGRRLTYATVYLTIFGEPIIFHLTSMEALQQIFYRTGLGQLAAALIVAAVMVPLGQVRVNVLSLKPRVITLCKHTSRDFRR